MAAEITTEFGHGGSGSTPYESGSPTLADALRATVDDVAALRTQFIALLAKMDTDFTAQNGAVAGSQLDVDYESTLTPAAQTLTKG